MTDLTPQLQTPSGKVKFFKNPEKYGVEILTNDWSKWSDDYNICQLKDFPANEIISYFHETVGSIEKYDKSCIYD